MKMTDCESKACEQVLEEGKLIRRIEGITADGKKIVSYEVERKGLIFQMTQWNGEWVFWMMVA